MRRHVADMLSTPWRFCDALDNHLDHIPKAQQQDMPAAIERMHRKLINGCLALHPHRSRFLPKLIVKRLPEGAHKIHRLRICFTNYSSDLCRCGAPLLLVLLRHDQCAASTEVLCNQEHLGRSLLYLM